MYQTIIQTLKCLLLGTIPNEKRNGVFTMLRTSTDSDNAEERAREIHTDLNLIIQSEQKELCFWHSNYYWTQNTWIYCSM